MFQLFALLIWNPSRLFVMFELHSSHLHLFKYNEFAILYQQQSSFWYSNERPWSDMFMHRSVPNGFSSLQFPLKIGVSRRFIWRSKWCLPFDIWGRSRQRRRITNSLLSQRRGRGTGAADVRSSHEGFPTDIAERCNTAGGHSWKVGEYQQFTLQGPFLRGSMGQSSLFDTYLMQNPGCSFIPNHQNHINLPKYPEDSATYGTKFFFRLH